MRALSTFATLVVPLFLLGFVASADDGDDAAQTDGTGKPKQVDRDPPPAIDEMTSVTLGTPLPEKGLVVHYMSHNHFINSRGGDRDPINHAPKNSTTVFLGEPNEQGRAIAAQYNHARHERGSRTWRASLARLNFWKSEEDDPVAQWFADQEFEVGVSVPIPLPEHMLSWNATMTLSSIEETRVLGDRVGVASFVFEATEMQFRGGDTDRDLFTWMQGSSRMAFDVETARPLYVYGGGAAYAPAYMGDEDVVEASGSSVMIRYEHYDDDDLAAFIAENEIENLDEFFPGEEDDE